MATILSIETATAVCSVAIGIDGNCIAFKETNELRTHSETITVFIDAIVKQSGITYKQLDGVAVSAGPGSYTGLRIGVSTAKGLCYAIEKPLLSVSTLLAMAYGARHSDSEDIKAIMVNENPASVLFCPMIDARRMEVYTAFYDTMLEEIKPVSSDIIDEHSYADLLANHKLLFFGDGAAKCKPAFAHQTNAIFLDNLLPSAVNMCALAEKKFKAEAFENLAYFEPFYLKDVNITKPKNKA